MLQTSALAQSVDQEPLNFNENLRDEAEVSGALFVGLQRFQKPPNAGTLNLSVEVPPKRLGEIGCLRVTTSNGLYDGIAEYELTVEAGLLPLKFPTKHADYLASRPDDGVAARFTFGPCSAQSSESAIVRWGPEETAPATVFLNAFRADRVYVYLDDAPDPVNCEPIRGGGRTAYDFRCELPELAMSAPTLLEVLTVTDGQPGDPATLTVLPMTSN